VDSTNADVALTRNRLRLELLPLLREKFNPQFDDALLRLAQQAAESVELLDALADALLNQVLLDESATVCRLDAAQLATHRNRSSGKLCGGCGYAGTGLDRKWASGNGSDWHNSSRNRAPSICQGD